MDAENMLDYMRKQHISENENSDSQSQPTQTSTSVENFSRKMGKLLLSFGLGISLWIMPKVWEKALYFACPFLQMKSWNMDGFMKFHD